MMTATRFLSFNPLSHLEALAKTLASRCGTGILPVFHGRDAHATRGFARSFSYLLPLTLLKIRRAA